jgi:hypothetical protein
MNLVRFVAFLAFVLSTNYRVVDSIPKKLYNDLLTEDNELLLIQQQSLSPKKAASINKTKNKNNTKKVESISSTNKVSSQLSNDIDAKNNGHLASKLIVNIVYASKQDDKMPASNTVSKRLVYEASNYLNPCDKNLCKSNETCVVVHENEHKCLPKRVKKKQIKQKNKKEEKTLITSNITRNYTFSQGCNRHKLIEFKLKLFPRFEKALKAQANNKKQMEITRINLSGSHCAEPVGFMLNLIDANNDELLSLNEWSELGVFKNEACSNDLFTECCAKNGADNTISYRQFCECFHGIEPKCKFMRDPHNLEIKNGYLDYLNEKFQTRNSNRKNETITLKLTAKNYVPLCDIRGHFLSYQCDNKVNCWCVDENGEPLLHTIKNIHEDPTDCTIN